MGTMYMNLVHRAENDPVLMESVRFQQEECHRLGLKTTLLIGYPAMCKKEIVQYAKAEEKREDVELGISLHDISCEELWQKAGTKETALYLMRLSAREKVIRKIFDKFHAEFGFYPSAIGGYIIDAATLSFIKAQYPQVKAAITNCFEEGVKMFAGNCNGWMLFSDGGPWSAAYPSRDNHLIPAQNEEDYVEIVGLPHLNRDMVLSLTSRDDYFASHPVNVMRAKACRGRESSYMYDFFDQWAKQAEHNGYSYYNVFVSAAWLTKGFQELFVDNYLEARGMYTDALEYYRENCDMGIAQCVTMTDLRPYIAHGDNTMGPDTAALYDGSNPFVISQEHRNSEAFCSIEYRGKTVSVKDRRTQARTCKDENGNHMLVPEPLRFDFEGEEYENPAKNMDWGETATYRYRAGEICEIGTLTLKSGESVYAEAGAVIQGRIHTEKFAENVRIGGYGILDGGLYRDNDSRTILMDCCKNAEIEDLTIIHTPGWHMMLAGCDGVRVDNVKEIGEVCGSDGVDIVGSRNVTVENCMFQTNDDCIAIKAFEGGYCDGAGNIIGTKGPSLWNSPVEHVRIQNCIFMNELCGNGIEIGHELQIEEVHDIVFRDLDIVRAEGFGAAISIHAGDRAAVRNITFENIRIENYSDFLIDFRVMKSRFNKDKERGRIDGVLLKNIRVNHRPEHLGYTMSVIGGWDAAHRRTDMIYRQTELHNCYGIADALEEPGKKMIRVPEWVRSGMGNIGKQYTAYNTPNTEIRFCMKSESVTLHFQIFHPEGSSYADQALEVYFGCFQDDNLRILDGTHSKITIKKPENMELLKRLASERHMSFSPEVVRVIAPGDCHLMLLDITGETEPPAAVQLPQKRWLAYGSSITQGSNGLHPSGSYAAIAAAALGVDLINFGFGGSALLEPEMADYLASRTDFNWISLEMGINMIWDTEKNCPGDPELFRRKVDYFVSAIADAHRDKWIFCLDLFCNKDDFTGEGLSGCYRRIVREKVEALGQDRVVYLNGLVYPDSPDGLCTDLIHPSAKGCAEIGNRLADAFAGYMKEGNQKRI